MRYEDDFLRYLQNIMADVDRRIRRGHARLNLSRDQEEKVCSHHYVLCTIHAIIFYLNGCLTVSLGLLNPFAPKPPVTARADPGPFYPL